MAGKEDASGGSRALCQSSGNRKMFWRSASWSTSRKARSGLPLLEPLLIPRRSLDEWPKAHFDDTCEWPPTPCWSGGEEYIGPHLRSRAGNELEEHFQFRRQVRGLLNRLSESNVESITGEMSVIFRSIARGIASDIISEEVLASCSTGPRGNEQYAAVFAAFVAGMACSVGVDFSAKLMASLAKTFEVEYLKEDNLSLKNLTLLLSYLCVFGVCSSDLIYDFLTMLSKHLKEVDVSTILTVLHCCGMKIRADDPLSMKIFIVSVQSRVIELKASSKGGQQNVNGKRMEFMLETISDRKKNNKLPKEDPADHREIKKWLQKSRVEEILIRGLSWSKLLDPDKKGQWWSSSDLAITTVLKNKLILRPNEPALSIKEFGPLSKSNP